MLLNFFIAFTSYFGSFQATQLEFTDDIPTYILFSHGFGGDISNVLLYKIITPNLFPFEMEAFNYPDSFILTLPFKLRYSSFAQEHDIQTLSKEINRLRSNLYKKHGDNYRIILFGVSRGASTIIMYLAQYKDELDHIAAAIVESPFDSMENVISELHPILKTTSKKLLPYSSYQKNYETPIQAATRIKPPMIPILVIGTTVDKIVPFKGTKQIYEALAANGVTVEFLEFSKGVHGILAFLATSSAYKKGVHEFLAKYKLLPICFCVNHKQENNL